MPVIKHLDGICHVYIDDKADPEKAIEVALNAKTQRYGTCNTMETLLVAEGVAEGSSCRAGRPVLAKGVELRGCERPAWLLREAVAATARGLGHRVPGADPLHSRGGGPR